MAIRFVQQERAFDSMFDPCYTSSAQGAQQYYREGPSYGSGMPVDTLQNTENLVTAVQGAHRYKFMKRPIVPFLHAVPPDILLAPPTVTQQDGPMMDQTRVDDAPTKTIGTQSDFRESEAQTDPFTPDYVVKEGETPEVLTLTAFKHGNGLPMGLREVELVERARLKRTVEASFPPVTDDRSFALRAQMMEALETKQWADREADLKRDQDTRLEKLEQQLQQRSAALEAKHEARVDQLRQVKLLQSENEVAIVQKRRIKAFRKLTEAQKHMVPTAKERDVVEEYASYGSKVYAPIRREGQSIIQDKNAERFETAPPQLATLEGMQSLEQQLPTKLIKSNANKALMNTNKGGTAGRRALLEAQHLDKVHKILKKNRQPMQKDTQKEQILKRYHKPPPLERPSTPTVEGMEEASNTPMPFGEMSDGPEVEVAVILLQRLLRGRMVQNMVYDAKEKRRELIEELRSVEQLEGSQELGSRRAPAVARQARGRIPVRQWAPEKIPCSERRAPEDRIRIKMFAHETMSLLEATETLQDFAMETGGEVEGPMVQAKKKLHMYLNKSPKGHKKTAKYHMNIEEHCWIMDYYPPAEGGLEAIMKIRLPHTVMVKIE